MSCPCKLREGEAALWCYQQNCPHTETRWPNEWQIARFGLDTKTLNRPGWEPGPKRKE